MSGCKKLDGHYVTTRGWEVNFSLSLLSSVDKCRKVLLHYWWVGLIYLNVCYAITRPGCKELFSQRLLVHFQRGKLYSTTYYNATTRVGSFCLFISSVDNCTYYNTTTRVCWTFSQGLLVHLQRWQGVSRQWAEECANTRRRASNYEFGVCTNTW